MAPVWGVVPGLGKVRLRLSNGKMVGVGTVRYYCFLTLISDRLVTKIVNSSGVFLDGSSSTTLCYITGVFPSKRGVLVCGMGVVGTDSGGSIFFCRDPASARGSVVKNKKVSCTCRCSMGCGVYRLEGGDEVEWGSLTICSI